MFDVLFPANPWYWHKVPTEVEAPHCPIFTPKVIFKEGDFLQINVLQSLFYIVKN